MNALVVRADAGKLPLPDKSVDLICTSPPYFALRSYTDGGEHYAGQIGSEPTPQEFLEALWAVTREWVRVLKPSGSIWVNLGDSYSGKPSGPQGVTGQRATRSSANEPFRAAAKRAVDVPAKSLRGLPWRYAIGCIDQLGLILRAEVIWSKPNGLPESVTDRVRRSHEQWFHFTVQPRYFSAVDEIREPHTADVKPRGLGSHRGRDDLGKGSASGWTTFADGSEKPSFQNPLGRLPGSVWTIPSEPLTVPDHLGVDHFAAFPTEWPRRIIQGWSPSGVCVECGEARRPTTEREGLGVVVKGNRRHVPGYEDPNRRPDARRDVVATITGYACACLTPDAPTRPSVVLDPFGGTGTTALCASVLGRIGISVDMSMDYSRLARWRTTDPASRAKARRVEKPPVELDGQELLFGGAA